MNLKIAGLNLDIIWKEKEENFALIEKELADIEADILLLPEMFATGFCMDAAEIADREEETLTWMKSFGRKKKAAVAGTAAVKVADKFYNRFYFVEPDGSTYDYDKRHLFTYSGEDRAYSPGSERTIVNYRGWRILLQTCYDLRFPVFSRNNDAYDAALYVANWPSTRVDAWTTLLKARAIENQAYVFGLNRIGTDGNGLHYPPSSFCFAADGADITNVNNNIVSATLEFGPLEKYRTRFPFLGDADAFSLDET